MQATLKFGLDECETRLVKTRQAMEHRGIDVFAVSECLANVPRELRIKN